MLKEAAKDGHKAVLILACDMIYYSSEDIRTMCSSYRGEDILFAVNEEGRREPFGSIYGTDTAEGIRKLIEGGNYRLRELADLYPGVGYYDFSSYKAFANINTEADLINGGY